MKNPKDIKFVFFGSSTFSTYVLEELAAAGFVPALHISSAREDLPMEKLASLDADVFVVASFGKILPQAVIDLPRHGMLNVHPSLLPRLRGSSPIQNTIINKEEKVGVSIIRMDALMDHGPILAQREVEIEPWPDYYETVEEKLGRTGGRILAGIMPNWISGELEAQEQEHAEATFTKLVKKEDGLIEESESEESKWRKVLAYSAWPKAHFFFTKKNGQQVRIVVNKAELFEGKFTPTRVTPEGKKEMGWQDFLKGNA